MAKADKSVASSSSFRLFSSGGNGNDSVERARVSSCKGNASSSTPRSKRISQRLMSGLKKAFGVRPSGNKESKNKVDLEGDREDDDHHGWKDELVLL